MGKGQARILFVDSSILMAGGQHSLVEILKCLDTSRFLPVVCTPARSGLRVKCGDLGIRWEPLPFESECAIPGRYAHMLWKAKDLLNSARGVAYLMDLIRKIEVDIVHANNFKAALAAAPACALTGTPMVFHDRILLTHGLLGRSVAHRAVRIIAVSETVAAKFACRFRRKTRVIPPGIDTTRFVPAPSDGGSKVVCYVGRISEEKGLAGMIECARAVLGREGDARFVIAGMPCTNRDSAYLSRLNLEIRSMGLKDRFDLPGHVEDVAGLLSRIDVFVLPSVKEPLGRVMIEAMLMEKPVVAFDAGGPAEVIVHGRTGLLAQPGDVDSLAENIVLLLQDAGLRREVGKEARESVIHRFSNRVVAESIMNLYDEVLAVEKYPGEGQAW